MNAPCNTRKINDMIIMILATSFQKVKNDVFLSVRSVIFILDYQQRRIKNLDHILRPSRILMIMSRCGSQNGGGDNWYSPT